MIHASDRHFLRPAVVLCLVCLFFSHSLFAAKDKDLRKHFGLIFGTAYGPDDRPLYGVKIEIHAVGRKNPHWEHVSDHQGEFAQRVPPGPADYLITGEVEIASPQNKKKKIKAEKTVHIQAEERQDVGLHLTD
jgi:hypothetical protein